MWTLRPSRECPPVEISSERKNRSRARWSSFLQVLNRATKVVRTHHQRSHHQHGLGPVKKRPSEALAVFSRGDDLDVVDTPCEAVCSRLALPPDSNQTPKSAHFPKPPKTPKSADSFGRVGQNRPFLWGGVCNFRVILRGQKPPKNRPNSDP